MSKWRILLVEPDKESQEKLSKLLDAFPYEYSIFAEVEKAMVLGADFAPNLVILANSKFVSHQNPKFDMVNQHLVGFFNSLDVSVALIMPISEEKPILDGTFIWQHEAVAAAATKPLDEQKMNNLITEGFRHWLGRQVPKILGDVLIVEPNKELRALLVTSLSENGEYIVIAADSDSEAIEQCKARKISVIVADENVAFELIKNDYIHAQQTDFYSQLSIIALMQQYSSGMFSHFDDVILKPVVIEDVHMRIMSCFELQRVSAISRLFDDWEKEQRKSG